jgi:DNA-binding LacI/PurR family transcriptional regulator
MNLIRINVFIRRLSYYSNLLSRNFIKNRLNSVYWKVRENPFISEIFETSLQSIQSHGGYINTQHSLSQVITF